MASVTRKVQIKAWSKTRSGQLTLYVTINHTDLCFATGITRDVLGLEETVVYMLPLMAQ